MRRLVVLAAVLVAAIAATGSLADKPPPREGQVALHYDLWPWSSSRPAVVLVARGPVPAHPTSLAVASGHDRIVAKPLEASDPRCQGRRYRFTGLGGSRHWCFVLDRLVASGSFTGKLRGTSALVTVTVTTRHVWCSGPLWTAFGAALAAVGLVLLTTLGLPARIIAFRLRYETGRTAKHVTGLDAWIRAARPRLTQGDLLAAVTWMRRQGTAALESTRANLAGALKSADAIPDDSPLWQAAHEEAEKRSIDASDLLGPDGKQATSNAGTLLGLIGHMQAVISEWLAEVGDLLTAVPPDHHEAAQRRIANGEAVVATLSASNTARVEARLDDVVEQLAIWSDAGRRPVYIPVGVGVGAVRALAGSGVAAGVGLLDLPSRFQFSRPRLRRLLPDANAVAAHGLTVIPLILLMAVAAATALVANYLPNDTFGSFADYASLAASVFGSATITGAAGAYVAWTKANDWRP